MPDGAYDVDPLSWAEHQAALLRRLAGGERLNETIDWPHVIAEVEDVGLSELRACQNLLRQAMVHLLKLHAWPKSTAVAHWREEVEVFLDDAEVRFTPSMRQRVDLVGLYVRALRRARGARDPSGDPQSLPDSCPFTLNALLAGDVAELVADISQTA